MKKIGYILGLASLLLLNTQSVKAFQPDSVFANRLKIIEKNIPYQLTEQLQDAINRKMYTNKTESELILTRSVTYLPLIEKELWQNDLPSEYKYIPVAMSGLDATGITYNGGAGIWGLQYIIAKRYGLQINEFEDERRDHIKSTCVSIHYIQDLQKIYGNWTLTLLSFITSPSDVNSAICRSGNSSDVWKIYEQMANSQKSLFIEFIASAYLLNFYDVYGMEKKQPDFEWANCKSYPCEANMSFTDLSTYLGCTENCLKQANPTIRSQYIPGGKGFTVRVPSSYDEKFLTYKPGEVLDVAVVQNQTTMAPTTIDKGDNKTTTTVDENKGSVHNSSNYFAVKTNNNSTNNKATTGSYQTQKSYYKVKSGDNLGKIAGKYNVSVSSLKSWNGLKSDKIVIGQKICIHKKVWVANKTVEATDTDKTENTDTNTENKTITTDIKTDKTIETKTDKTVVDTKTTTTDTKTTVKTTNTKSWVTYKVKSGDTLYKIAKNNSVTITDLKNNNNIIGDKIIVGQTLKIKSK